MNLFDGMEARDSAIDKVEAGANPRERARIQEIVLGIARARGETGFTTDAVWAACEREGLEPSERRIMGSVILSLAKRKQITKTGQWKVSERQACHSRPIPVWRKTK